MSNVIYIDPFNEADLPLTDSLIDKKIVNVGFTKNGTLILVLDDGSNVEIVGQGSETCEVEVQISK